MTNRAGSKILASSCICMKFQCQCHETQGILFGERRFLYAVRDGEERRMEAARLYGCMGCAHCIPKQDSVCQFLGSSKGCHQCFRNMQVRRISHRGGNVPRATADLRKARGTGMSALDSRRSSHHSRPRHRKTCRDTRNLRRQAWEFPPLEWWKEKKPGSSCTKTTV